MRTRLRQTSIMLSAALLALTGLSVLAVDSPPAQHPSKPAALAISKLLTAETTPGKVRAESIAPLYQEAAALAPRDPRLEYAYSLVLLRLFQPAEARVHLDRALALDPAFAPANQCVIRELLKSRQFAEAAERTSRFAEKLDPARPESPDVAEWLGRIVAAVVTSIGTPDAQTLFAYQDRMLRTSLPVVLRSRYEKGYADVERALEDLRDSIGDARSAAQNKQEAVKAKLDADLVKDQEEIKIKQQDAQKTRQKWDEWINDQTAKADDLLKQQEKSYSNLQTAVAAQLEAVAALRVQVSLLQSGAVSQLQQMQQQSQRNRKSSSSASFPGFVVTPNPGALEMQLAVEERRLAGFYDQQAAVASAAQRIIAVRNQAVAQYREATGVVLKESDTLDRWEKRNKSIAENQKKAAEKKPAQVATLEAKIKSLSTWDSTDFESEKAKLLADLGVTIK